MIVKNCSLGIASSCSKTADGKQSETSSTQFSGSHGNEVDGFKERLANAFNVALNTVKKKLGFVDCYNGGRRTNQGVCECLPYFKGDNCEELICVNNGTKVELPNKPPFCKCAHPQYISGEHCELVKCDNNGQPLSNGHCRCLDYWYTGQFCESYTASWGAVIGVPLVCITVIVICCIICRLDFCPRRKARQMRRRRFGDLAEPASVRTGRWVRSIEDQMQQRRMFRQRGNDSALRLQENLLNEDNRNRSQNTRTESNVVPTYTIRLDTIPVFNPRMIGGVSERDIKLMEPPPPYEQAISSNFSQRFNNPNTSAGLPRPPEYTPSASHSAFSGTVPSAC